MDGEGLPEAEEGDLGDSRPATHADTQNGERINVRNIANVLL